MGMDVEEGAGSWTPPSGIAPPAPRDRGRDRVRIFASGLIAGAVLTLALVFAWSYLDGAPRPVRDPRPESVTAPAPAASGTVRSLESSGDRWETLRAEFLDAAAPVLEALDRTERLGNEPPPRRPPLQDAEIAYQSAKAAREAAEKDATDFAAGDARTQEQAVRGAVAKAEENLNRIKAHTDDVKRNRQRLVDLWVSQGRTKEAAETAGDALFYKDLKADEPKLQRAEIARNLAKGKLDLLTRYSRDKRAKLLQSEVEARRAEELARQLDLEKARAEQAGDEAQSNRLELSPEESRRLDALAEVLSTAGTHPPRDGDSDGDPNADGAFFERFAAGLDEVRAATRPRARSGNVAGRYNAAVSRILRARGGSGRE